LEEERWPQPAGRSRAVGPVYCGTDVAIAVRHADGLPDVLAQLYCYSATACQNRRSGKAVWRAIMIAFKIFVHVVNLVRACRDFDFASLTSIASLAALYSAAY
jgi:hypothetical protein